MSQAHTTRTGRCHCGAVRFEARLTADLATARRCTCSLCRMRGAVAVTAETDGVTILSGQERLSSYRFNTGTAQHFFCSTCGVYTHHQRRSDPSRYGVNVACLDGLSPFDLAEVPVMDGEHHPSDVGGASVQVGVLRYQQSAD